MFGDYQKFLLCAIFTLGSCHHMGEDPNVNGANTLKLELKNVDAVEVLYFPVHLRTRARLEPSDLERLWRYKLTIRGDSTSAMRALLADIEKTSFVPQDTSPDVRWGIKCYNESGDVMLSLYFDEPGQAGIVNGRSVSINGNVSKSVGRTLEGVGE